MNITILLPALLPALFLTTGYSAIMTYYLVKSEKIHPFWQKKRKHVLVVNDHRVKVRGSENFIRCYECVVCDQYWIGAGGAEYDTCPGIRYYLFAPDHLMTQKRLQMIGYTSTSPRIGCDDKHEDLYDISDATPLPTATHAQIEAMQRMREARIQELEQAILKELEQ